MQTKTEYLDNFHGTMVADPYRWLEDTDSADTQEWTEKMKADCKQYFSDCSSKETDRKRLEELWDFPKYFVPEQVKNRLFFQKNDGLQNQAVLYIQEDDKEPVAVIDPNALSEDGTLSLSNFSISHDAKYIAYAISASGSDWQVIYVRDLQTMKDTTDHLEYIKFTNIAWSPDNSGFYYSRFPEPGSVAEEDESNYQRVYFHRLGDDQAGDTLIYEHLEDKELMFSPFITDDKKYLGLEGFLGTAAENRIYLKSLKEDGEFIRLFDKQDAEYQYVTNKGNIFYFMTSKGAPNRRLIAVDINKPAAENWQEIIPEAKDVLDYAVYLEDTFILAYLHDAYHQLHTCKVDGSHTKEIALQSYGSLTGISCDKENSLVYFGMTSFLNPATIYQYHVTGQKVTVHAASEMSVDTAVFETTQVFYTSKDGTKAPMFITKRKDIQLDSQNPVILYGYGGFSVNMTPSFNPAILRWLEKGGIYAVAVLRGGNEYGEAWHQAGMLANKQNVFDDFIAAGEYLIAEKYTSKKKLSIMGGSNGGLLVAACMVQRPDLYGAVLCRVPVIDMLRYHKFTIGRYWIPEYGNAENPEQFEFMYAYSPLHNIQDGALYPPVLIATAASDDRVVPAHAKKFAATLLEKADASSTVVLRVEDKAGHGHGKPTAKLIAEWVDFYAFLDRELS